MNDQSKKLKNPLLSAFVTGGTFEDYSQNAILLPAKEKPPPPTLNLSHEQILNDIISNSSRTHQGNLNPDYSGATYSEFSTNNPTAVNQNLPESSTQAAATTTFSQELPDIATLQPHLSSAPSHTSHLSSVFSSFSSILNIGSSNANNNNNIKDEVVVAPPAGIESLIAQENINPQPVPLFSADTTEFTQQKPPTTTGTSNQFRRSGLKRPTYAQVPGLSSAPEPLPPQNLSPPQNLPPLPVNPQPAYPYPAYPQPVSQYTSASFFVPPAPSPANSQSSNPSFEVTQISHNQFKPISPPPPTLQNIYTSPHPVVPVPVQPLNSGHSQFVNFNPPVSLTQPINLIQPVSSTGTILTPVMGDIPPSEFSQGSNLHVSTATTVTSPVSTTQVNPPVNQVYRPVYNHWFFQRDLEAKKIWQPFSMVDSLALEQAFTSNDLDPEKLISTDGGRYDVNILRRERYSVYWKADPTEVRRCSWFHKNSPDGRLIPYEENVATQLEEEYKAAFESNQWHRKIELPGGEMIVLHGPDVLVLFSQTQVPDAWGNSTNQSRPRVVKRGMDEFDIDEGEPPQVDHILFMVHGIGSVCDLKFRTVELVVDEFRNIAFQLVQSHYKSSSDVGKVNRVEVLPISWHDRLHSDETGIDEQLKLITLESIPKLRGFTNDTLLDILFYTSPVYCQKIISTVGNELNRIYDLFKQRNPEFKGGVSLGGHSLGSLILFDLLCHQDSKRESESEESDDILSSEKPAPKDRRMSKRISYMMGSIGTGQPQIHYPRLNFEPSTFFALGSPIGMFVIVRGLDNLGENFSLPTCPAFFNIFHPYDPIAYRIESLINRKLGELKPVLIPHHKGRKRMHLELKETMARVGADLKQKVVDSMRNTWNSVYQLAMFHKQTPPNLEEEVSKAFRDQMGGDKEDQESEQIQDTTDLPVGNLNNGRRVDYVLQEAPFEFFNEYIFALTSHVCYWESEDTILLMLKEIYTSMGITSDNQIPQQTMTIERPSPSPTLLRKPKVSCSPVQQSMGIDPTRPIHMPVNVQPPPMAGFIRKT